MKKFIFATLTLFLLNFSAFAQMHVGLAFGPSMSNMTIDGAESLIQSPEMYVGLRTGATASYQFSDLFSLQSGVFYHRTGFQVNESIGLDVFNQDIPLGLKAITQLHFLEIPVLARLNVGTEKVKWYIEGGPQLSYAMDGEVRTRASFLVDFNLGRYDINMANSNFRKVEWTGVVGTGLDIGLNEYLNLELGAQYMHGFTDLTEEPIVDIRTKRRAGAVTAGLKYQF
ncbi:MAG: PorT family protein [Saprospiraceae bacterium]|nr:PorT family protein [Saprospiraceae bacterium]MBK9630609.1 PorT family protein [Saprospiraceae bacterium]